MKFNSFLIWFFLLFCGFHVAAKDLDQIREEFFQCTLASEKAHNLIQTLGKIDSPSPTELAYLGAAEAVHTQTLWNPFAKVKNVKASMLHINSAVEKESDNLEIIFLRFSVQHHIPSFLGMSKDLENDKNRIVELASNGVIPDLNLQIRTYIVTFMERCGLCSEEELAIIRQKLA